MLLVVGATGQVGSRVVHLLRRAGRPVRAMARRTATAQDLAATGAEVVPADLRDPATLEAALRGVDAVIATANVAVPSRRGDTVDAVMERGYRALVDLAARAGVPRFVLASVPATDIDDSVPLVRAKRRLEETLDSSGLSCLHLRLAPFTEVWLAVAGSSLLLRGERRATVDRADPAVRRLRRLTGHLAEERGLLLVPGRPSAHHAFISVDDVARALVAGADRTELTGPVDLGGPQALSWVEVADLLGSVLGRPVRPVGIPTNVLRAAEAALAPVATSAATVVSLYRYLARTETSWDTTPAAQRLGIGELRTVADVLREKAALDPAPAGRA